MGSRGVCSAVFGALTAAASAQSLEFVDTSIDLVPPDSGVGFAEFGDFDGDGRLDLVAREFLGSEDLFVSLGAGVDAFAPPQLQSEVPAHDELRVADVDLDGRDDLVVLVDETTLAVYEFGEFFAPTQTVVLPEDCAGLAVGRIDRDAWPDVVVGGTETGRLNIYPNVDGMLTGPIEASGDADVTGLAIVDFGGDERADIVSVGWEFTVTPPMATPSVRVLVQQGAGDFVFAPVDVDLPAEASNVATSGVIIGDVDGDGSDDLIVALPGFPGSFDRGSVIVFGGNGPQAAESAWIDWLVRRSFDVDDDGDVELVTSGGLIDWVAEGIERRLFGQPIASADVDDDGFSDVIVRAFDGAFIAHGIGEIAWRELVPFANFNNPSAVLADIDGDTRTDLLLDGLRGVQVAFAGIGQTFDASETSTEIGFSSLVDANDVDGDGLVDVIGVRGGLRSGEPTSLTVAFGGSSPQVVTTEFLRLPTTGTRGDFASTPSVGSAFEAVVYQVTPELPFEHWVFSVLDGDRDGHAEVRARVELDEIDGIPDAFLSDVDGDGVNDVVIATRTDTASVLQTYLSGPGGALEPVDPPLVFEGSLTFFEPVVDLVDVDLDGHVDVVFAVGADFGLSATLSVAKGLGNGAFDEPIDVATFDVLITGVLVEDVTGDALPDVVATVSGTDFQILEQVAPDVFELVAQGTTPVPASVTGIAADDIDGDGALDVLVTSSSGDATVAVAYGADGTWQRVGDSLAGPSGFSSLRAEGLLEAGSTITIEAPNGPPNARIAFVLGLDAGETPFLGGVLVPTPDVIVSMTTDGDGGALISRTWRDGSPDAEVYVQAWYPDEPASTIALRGRALR